MDPLKSLPDRTSTLDCGSLPSARPSGPIRRTVRRLIGLAIKLTILFVSVWVAWEIGNTTGESATLENTIAMSWGDGKDGPAFYGCRVYVVPTKHGLDVCARILIDTNNYVHDCGVIGHAATRADAVERWGTVMWRPDGVHIGRDDSGAYFLPQSTIEAHR